MLFVAKFAAPCATGEILQEQIYNQAAEREITLFAAPAGYLHTESLSAVLSNHNRSILWLRLGPEDRDPARFLLSIISLCEWHYPDKNFSALEQMRAKPGPICGWPALFSYLGSELAEALPSATTLVIENVHHLNNTSPVLGLANRHLLPQLLGNINLILISGQKLVEGIFPSPTKYQYAKDLRLDYEAASEYLERFQVDLPDSDLQRAVRLTEGRAVALAGIFSAQNLIGGAVVQKALDNSRNVSGLLKNLAHGIFVIEDSEALTSLALALRIGYNHPQLIQSATPERLPPGGPWFQPLADRWARLRQLWRPSLQALVHTLSKPDIEILRGAADFLANQGADDQALSIYIEIGDMQRIADLISKNVDILMNTGQWETMRSWLERLPADALRTRPWLIYFGGEISAANGNTREAREAFNRAAVLFSERQDYEGACQSLLAESLIAFWGGDYDRAKACALSANAYATTANLTQQWGWSSWQLGCLAFLEGRLEDAFTYFGQLVEVINEPHLADLVHQVQELVLKQRDLKEQQEFHRMASREIEHDLDESAQRLDQLFNSVPEHPDQLLGKYGWSQIPLVFKLSAPIDTVQPIESSPIEDLKQRLVKVLEIIRQFSGSKGKEPSSIWEMETDPTAVSDSHIFNISSWSNILGVGNLPREIGAPSRTIASTNTPIERTAQKIHSRLTAPVQEPIRPIPNADRSLELAKPVILSAYFMGNFVIYLNDESVDEWPGSRSLAMLKYLLIHRNQNVPREVLMETFWPEAVPEASRNSLNVAIHGLRKSLRSFTEIPVVVFDDGAYRFSQDVSIWIDAEEFKRHFQSGRQLESVGRLSAAIQEYETAISLYKGEFLADDPYEEWTISMREHLRLAYLDASDHLSQIYFAKRQYTACANLCQIILELDDCSEAAHRLLMRCYSRQGQHNLALRQYRICEERLRAELNIEPAEDTVQLFERIRRREGV